ncbi:MAG: thioredoxin family protein [Phycisphaerales bacterium]|nr:thioredoxin family protein [Phycisphaerales bacterium]
MSTLTTPRLSVDYLKAKFDGAQDYATYVARGNDKQRAAWAEIYERASLTSDQQALVGGFTRQMHVLAVSGVWCGDCVQQMPFLQRIAEANSATLHFRLADRDEHMDLAQQVQINQGARVPVVLFMAEDFELVSVFGDRTLSRYRAIAARQLGASCPIPGAPLAEDELRAGLQDWLNEVERNQLLLRLSARLRGKHSD